MPKTRTIELPEEVVESIATRNIVSQRFEPTITEACKVALGLCRCGHRPGQHDKTGQCNIAACGCAELRNLTRELEG